jgi:hypothetical protein
VAIIHKNNLTIFGYILDKKLAKRKQNPSIFLTTHWNLSYKFCDLEKKVPSKSGQFGPFFPWKNLYLGGNHIF